MYCEGEREEFPDSEFERRDRKWWHKDKGHYSDGREASSSSPRVFRREQDEHRAEPG